jgi:hypothetical protein
VCDKRIAAAGLVLAALLLTPVLRADDLDLGQPEPAENAVAWSGDLFIRSERLRSWAKGDNESRTWARLRYGPTWQINDQWTLGAAAKLHASTDGNEDTVNYNDNELARHLSLDKWFVAYSPAEGDRLIVGKDEFPLTLSRMLWDPDNRPAGVSYTWQTKFGDDDRLRLTGGAFRGLFMDGDLSKAAVAQFPENSVFYPQDSSRIGAFQADLNLHEQATVQPEFVLSYLHFTDLNPLLGAGEDRGNPAPATVSCNPYSSVCILSAPPVFLDQFEIVDLQFALHVHTETPFRLLLDVDQNQGAVGDDKRAERMELALGDSFVGGGNEFGYAKEHIGASAAQGAFNDDDWWFHAGMRGDMLWYGYGISDTLRLRLGYFWERPDGSNWHWRRAMLDLQVKL